MINTNNVPLLTCDQGDAVMNGMEAHKDNSNSPLNVIINDNLISGGGVVELDGGCSKVDRLVEADGLELGQEGVEGGPILSNKSIQAVKGGVNRRENNSGDVGRPTKPKSLEGDVVREKEKRKGGVYSIGPSGVYKLLHTCPPHEVSSSQQKQNGTLTKKGKATFPYIPPSASLRKQHLMAKSLSNRTVHSHSNSMAASVPSLHAPATLSCPVGGVAESSSLAEGGVTRGPVMPNQANSGAGSIGSCLILSADIRNCNKRFLNGLEQEVVSKVWKGALDLGVVCNSLGGREGVDIAEGLEAVCLKEIQDNEKRDEEGKLRREHSKSLHQ
jgi:hypothetical protein